MKTEFFYALPNTAVFFFCKGKCFYWIFQIFRKIFAKFKFLTLYYIYYITILITNCYRKISKIRAKVPPYPRIGKSAYRGGNYSLNSADCCQSWVVGTLWIIISCCGIFLHYRIPYQRVPLAKSRPPSGSRTALGIDTVGCPRLSCQS